MSGRTCAYTSIVIDTFELSEPPVGISRSARRITDPARATRCVKRVAVYPSGFVTDADGVMRVPYRQSALPTLV